jgi:hypothetical protein
MTIHDSDVSLPSTGSAQALRSPASSVLSRRCDSLMPISLRFVAFAIAIPRQHTAFLSLPSPSCAFLATGLELVHPATPARVPTRGDIRGSQVPVEPHLFVCTCSRDPGRTGVSDRFAKRPCCPRSFNREGSDDSTIEAQLHGFRTRRLRFVVPVAHPHARLAPGRRSGFAGRDFRP